jgi:large subunit ribosomal protein L3
MAVGLIGIKRGMSRIFNEDVSVPVTIIQIEQNSVVAKPEGKLQVTMGRVKPSRVNKPMAGQFAKANVAPGRGLYEFKVSPEESEKFAIGAALDLTQFEVGQRVDVRARTKGKGFAGTVKRHNFATQDATHGNSRSHRVPGSIGQNQTPGRVFKGKRMSGHMGDKYITMQSLEIAAIDHENALLVLKGAVPGATGAIVRVVAAVRDASSK